MDEKQMCARPKRNTLFTFDDISDGSLDNVHP